LTSNIEEPAKKITTAAPRFSKGLLGLAFGAMGLLTVFAAWYLHNGYNVIWVTILMGAFFVILGLYRNNRFGGILINERNLMSLSRFQSVVWTVLILSAYLTIAFARIRAGNVADPLAVEIDWRLWALMGISMTSLIGAPLILSNKKAKIPDQGSLSQILDQNTEALDPAEGLLYYNASPAEAAFTDMFEGDEVRDTNFLDIVKVQMFFFTIVAAISYEAMVIQTVRTLAPEAINSLPALSEGFLAIFGISHAGYLTGKTVSPTPTVK
jgi:hypothetical protein